MHEDLLCDPLPDDVLTAPPRPANHARYFGALSTQADRSTIRTILRLIEREHRPRTRAGYEAGEVTAREQIEACGV